MEKQSPADDGITVYGKLKCAFGQRLASTKAQCTPGLLNIKQVVAVDLTSN